MFAAWLVMKFIDITMIVNIYMIPSSSENHLQIYYNMVCFSSDDPPVGAKTVAQGGFPVLGPGGNLPRTKNFVNILRRS